MSSFLPLSSPTPLQHCLHSHIAFSIFYGSSVTLLGVTAKLQRHLTPPCQPPPRHPISDVRQVVLLPTFQDQFAKLATFSELAWHELSTEGAEDTWQASCGLGVRSETPKAWLDKRKGVKHNRADKCRFLNNELHKVASKWSGTC